MTWYFDIIFMRTISCELKDYMSIKGSVYFYHKKSTYARDLALFCDLPHEIYFSIKKWCKKVWSMKIVTGSASGLLMIWHIWHFFLLLFDASRICFWRSILYTLCNYFEWRTSSRKNQVDNVMVWRLKSNNKKNGWSIWVFCRAHHHHHHHQTHV